MRFALATLLLLAGPAYGDYATKVRIGDDVELSLYTPRMFRVRISTLPGEKFPERYEIPFAIGHLDDWEPVSFEQRRGERYRYVETEALLIRIAEDRSFSVWAKDGGARIYPSAGPTFGMFRDGYTVFDSASALGERNDNSRYAHWFYDRETGRYVDTYLAEDQLFDEYFIYGPSYEDLFFQLNLLVGPEPLLPKKAFGFFQTQHLECDGDQTQLMELARRLRAREIPTDTLIIDFEWGDGCPGQEEENWGRLDWAPAYTAPLSPAEMLSELEAMHYDVMLIHHSVPGFAHRSEHTPRRVRDWTSKVYDEQLWWEAIEAELAAGVDGTWQDTRQNDVSDSVIWNGLRGHWGEDRRVLFMGCRKMMELNPWELDRDNTIPATSLVGSRRYPFRWTGDIARTYRELQWQIRAITNTHGSMKGVSYLTADNYAKDYEHFARWNQFVDFLPVSRSHTMKPWEFDARAEASIRKHRELRYQLLPYIYSTAHENYRTGLPLTRPLVLAFPDDVRVNQDQWPYQYLFGPNLLVAPVYGDSRSMEIYLPDGSDWIDYWSGEALSGGRVIDYDTSDIAKMPLFVRAGAILPMQEAGLFIDPSAQSEPLTLEIYPSGDSAFVLYEDDGVSTGYQRGAVAATRIESRESEDALLITIGASIGSYSGKPESRDYLLRVRGVDPPLSVELDGREIESRSEGRVLELSFRAETWLPVTIATTFR